MYIVMVQVPLTNSTWLESEKLLVNTSVVGLTLAPPQYIEVEADQGRFLPGHIEQS
jgi:hypothetical protein